MPVLTLENGKRYSESVAIARHFATKFNLVGQTDEERLHANMVVEVLRMDIFPVIVKILLGKEEEKADLRKEAQAKVDGLLKSLNEHYVSGSATFLGSLLIKGT